MKSIMHKPALDGIAILKRATVESRAKRAQLQIIDILADTLKLSGFKDVKHSDTGIYGQLSDELGINISVLVHNNQK